MEDLSRRVLELETLATRLLYDAEAAELVVKALITSHPNVATFRAALSSVRSGHEIAIEDRGLSIGLPAKNAGQMKAAMAESMARWDRFLSR